MSPVEREREKLRSSEEITEEQQSSIQACSVVPVHDVAGPLGVSDDTLNFS